MRKPRYVCSPRFAIRKCLRGEKLNQWEIEKIAKDPLNAVRYADRILKGRFEAAEEYIASHPNASLQYATVVIKGRWEKGEASIVTSSDVSFAYCTSVINGRWEMGEKSILEKMSNSVRYALEVVGGRWDLFENNLLTGKYDKDPRHYFNDHLDKYFSLISGRWPEWEERIFKRNRASLIYKYCRHINGRLPEELHQKMMMYSFDPKRSGWAKKYVKYLEQCNEMARKYIAQMTDEEFQKLVSSRV